MRKRLLSILLLVSLLLLIFSPASAQAYYFKLPKFTVDAYWNSDGTEAIDYTYYFENDPSGHVIDFVDVGLPNSSYSDSNITANVDGHQVYDISSSGFQGTGGVGVAVGLGNYSIPPGGSGTVQVHIEQISNVLYVDSQDKNYASAVLIPAYFESKIISGNTDYTITFHLPPGIKPDEPKWHAAPNGFPSQPTTGLDSQNRVTYTWHNPDANGHTSYQFGASFPNSYIPSGTIVTVNPWAGVISFVSTAAVPLICIGFFAVIVIAGFTSDSKRRRQYLPPKISIEGHGIKRGLTAVEAAILLEEPLDKVMTMILFSVVKKNAAEVVTKDPLELKITQPAPEGLQSYETDFLAAFAEKGADRNKLMSTMVVNLVKSVSIKMKGFSGRETVDYYRDITKRAWEQVEAAETPEVKSQKYEEVMEWTMLDKNYDGRTQEVFRNTPVFVPMWWGHYDPGLGGGGSFRPSAAPSSSGVGRVSVPGSDFAASVATGVQTFSSKVVGNINTFTSSITSVTNPPPKVSSGTYKGGGFSGGGHSCACACACAGCACACAGGGR